MINLRNSPFLWFALLLLLAYSVPQFIPMGSDCFVGDHAGMWHDQFVQIQAWHADPVYRSYWHPDHGRWDNTCHLFCRRNISKRIADLISPDARRRQRHGGFKSKRAIHHTQMQAGRTP